MTSKNSRQRLNDLLIFNNEQFLACLLIFLGLGLVFSTKAESKNCNIAKVITNGQE